MTKRSVKFRIGWFFFYKPREKQINFQLNENWKEEIPNLCIEISSSLIFMENEGMVLSIGFGVRVKQATLNAWSLTGEFRMHILHTVLKHSQWYWQGEFIQQSRSGFFYWLSFYFIIHALNVWFKRCYCKEKFEVRNLGVKKGWCSLVSLTKCFFVIWGGIC